MKTESYAPSSPLPFGALSEADRARLDERLEIAWRMVQDGDTDQGLEEYEQICDEFPTSADAHNLLGMTLLSEERFDEAERALSRSLGINPTRADAWYNRGVANEARKNTNQALIDYNQALRLTPEFLEAGFQLCRLLARYRRFDDAYNVALNTGARLAGANNPHHALVLLREAAGWKPEAAAVNHGLGQCYLVQGRLFDAQLFLRRALASEPERLEARNLLGLALYHDGKIGEAIKEFETLLKDQPIHPYARNNLGNCHSRLGDYRESIKQYRFAINQMSLYKEAHINLIQDLHASGQLDEAERMCEEALSLWPDLALAHSTAAWLLLARGEYTRGWREFEWRVPATHQGRYLGDPRNPEQPLPRPSSLSLNDLNDSRVLLLGSGGLGTELFFMRFVPQLRAAGCTWIGYATSPRMAQLLNEHEAFDAILSPEQAANAQFDHAFAIGDLPLVLGHRNGESLGEPLTLTPSAAAVNEMQNRLSAAGPGPYLALTWESGLAADGPRRKRVSPDALGKAVRNWPGTLVSVQRQPAADDYRALIGGAERDVADFSDVNDDLPQALALMGLVDEYVGVSNTNVYLALAQPRVTPRVLVKQPAEWRWTASEGGASPWYPSAHLYTEHHAKGWGPALAALANDLQ
ncbi:MAG: tetratricopeptide repeat protein [Gammaproteobacteria bacterium]|nr:tetratricopeptide repeat protein [Gammaproteobacteria bacterium]